MPHKRNPVSSTVILAAHTAAPGLAATLFAAMAAEDQRPVGLWHAEWHALPSLFGLASGALREARALAEGLVIDQARMRANLELTQGLIFADAVTAVLAAKLGRVKAEAVIVKAVDAVRNGGGQLRDVLAANAGVTASLRPDIVAAFDLAPSLAAAARFADRAVAAAAPVVKMLKKR